MCYIWSLYTHQTVCGTWIFISNAIYVFFRFASVFARLFWSFFSHVLFPRFALFAPKVVFFYFGQKKKHIISVSENAHMRHIADFYTTATTIAVQFHWHTDWQNRAKTKKRGKHEEKTRKRIVNFFSLWKNYIQWVKDLNVAASAKCRRASKEINFCCHCHLLLYEFNSV